MRTRRNKTADRETTLRQALHRLREVLHSRSLRTTEVRETIVQAALAFRGHFDVDELAARVRSSGISKATVYRAMPLLVEAGILQPTVLSAQKQRYEATFGRAHHDHLVCKCCGEIVEFQFEAFEMLQRELATKHGYRLTSHVHELIGVCAKCQQRENERRS